MSNECFQSNDRVRLKSDLPKEAKDALFPEFQQNNTYIVDRQNGDMVRLYQKIGGSISVNKKHLVKIP